MARDLFYDRRQVLKNKWAIENLKSQVEKGGGISDDVMLTIKRQDFYYTDDESYYEWLQGKADALGYTLEDKTITFIDDDNMELSTVSGKLLSRIVYCRYLKDVPFDEISNFLNNNKSIIKSEQKTLVEHRGIAPILNGELIENMNQVVDELEFVVKDFDLIRVFNIYINNEVL